MSAVIDFCSVASSARCCAGMSAPSTNRCARTTASLALGCVLAGIAVAGCALVALLRPQVALDRAQIVMGRESGALYVRVGDTWHPVLNLASARLIAATDANPQPVPESELGRTKRGPLLGIPGAPQLLGRPLTGDEAAWTICDTDGNPATTIVVGRTDRIVGPSAGSRTGHPGRRRLGFAGLPALQRAAGRGGSRRRRGCACAQAGGPRPAHRLAGFAERRPGSAGDHRATDSRRRRRGERAARIYGRQRAAHHPRRW